MPSALISGLGEAFSGEVYDGGGRVIGTLSDHPGSTGLYSAQLSTYNNMGRLVQQSNTATNSHSDNAAAETYTASEDRGEYL